MFFRIPDQFVLEVKQIKDFSLFSSEYRCNEIEQDFFEEKNLFEDADEEYINENINK